MINLDSINAGLADLVKCTEGIIGQVHGNVPGAEHIKRMIPLPSVMLMDEVTEPVRTWTCTIVKWCHDQLAKDLVGRVGLIRRMEVKMLHETITLAHHSPAEIGIRENVGYAVDVTFPALVYRLFTLPAENKVARAPIPGGTLQSEQHEPALNPANWRCQCPMCEHHRTAAAIINAEGQGINAAPALRLTVENAMRQIQERQG